MLCTRYSTCILYTYTLRQVYFVYLSFSFYLSIVWPRSLDQLNILINLIYKMGQNFLYILYSRVKSFIEVIGTGIRELILIRIQPAIKTTGSRSSRQQKPDLGPTLLNNLDPVLIQFTLNFCNFKSLYI